MIQQSPQKWPREIKVLIEYLFNSLNVPAIGFGQFAFGYVANNRPGPLGMELQSNMPPVRNKGLIAAILTCRPSDTVFWNGKCLAMPLNKCIRLRQFGQARFLNRWKVEIDFVPANF